MLNGTIRKIQRISHQGKTWNLTSFSIIWRSGSSLKITWSNYHTPWHCNIITLNKSLVSKSWSAWRTYAQCCFLLSLDVCMSLRLVHLVHLVSCKFVVSIAIWLFWMCSVKTMYIFFIKGLKSLYLLSYKKIKIKNINLFRSLK